MNPPNLTFPQFFRVMGSSQSYLNLIYLFATFPLGLFYFVYLVSGLSTGISLVIVWVGIPILLVIAAGWWILARFERYMAIHLLKEQVSTMGPPLTRDDSTWARFQAYFTNPVTWKSLVYLILKFPLGLATFTILVVLMACTAALVSTPFTYQSIQLFQGSFFSLGATGWQIDTLPEALLAALIGLLLWPITLHISNALAWAHAKFANIMLGAHPWE
jgi:hypothetical protein